MHRTRRSLLAAAVLLPLVGLFAAAPALATPRAAMTTSTNAYFQGVACAGASNCEAVGGWAYQSTPNISRTLAEHWNGSKWSIQKTTNPGGTGYASLSSVACPGRSNCYAVGANLRGGVELPIAMHWNGRKWSADKVAFPANSSAYLAAVTCVGAADCIAVGEFKNGSGRTRSLVERWKGSKLSAQEPVVRSASSSYLNGISCPGTKSCFAVGEAENSSGQYKNIAERWNGRKWSEQPVTAPAGVDSSDLNAVACHTATSCMAAGYITRDSFAVDESLGQHWNGAKWNVSLPVSPARGADVEVLYGVACPGASGCTAVGVYEVGSEGQVMLAEHWNGTTWKVVKTARPAGSAGSSLAAVTCTSTSSCVAVGQSWSGTKTLVYAALAERWNGSKWTLMRTPKP